MNRYTENIAIFSHEELIVILATISKFNPTVCHMVMTQDQSTGKYSAKLVEVSKPAENPNGGAS
jgi:hypothetical protein